MLQLRNTYFYVVVLVLLGIPLGTYIGKVMNGERTLLSKVLTPCENAVYKVMRVDKNEDMSWKKICGLRTGLFGHWAALLFSAAAAAGVFAGQPTGSGQCEVGFSA